MPILMDDDELETQLKLCAFALCEELIRVYRKALGEERVFGLTPKLRHLITEYAGIAILKKSRDETSPFQKAQEELDCNGYASGCRSCLRAYGILGCQPWSEDTSICTKCAVKEGLVDPENDWNQENKYRPD